MRMLSRSPQEGAACTNEECVNEQGRIGGMWNGIVLTLLAECYVAKDEQVMFCAVVQHCFLFIKPKIMS